MRCARCGEEIGDAATGCVHCGARAADDVPLTAAEQERRLIALGIIRHEPLLISPSPPVEGILHGGARFEIPPAPAIPPAAPLLGALGALLLGLGVFCPIISVPIFGSVTYFNGGRGNGIVVLGFAIISLVSMLKKQYAWLWIPAMGTVTTLLYTYVLLRARLAEAQLSLVRDLADNPFRSIGEAALASTRMQWGWAVLILGALCTLTAAILGGRQTGKTTTIV